MAVTQPEAGLPARLDCAGAEVGPGAVNAHTHLYSGLCALGMPAPALAPTTFLEILERVWWRLDRALDAASLRAAARLYVAEALLAGTTTLIDHHESPGFIDGALDVLADAAQELGVRALLCYGASERNHGRAEGQRGLAECARLARRVAGDAGVRGLVGLHASFTVSDDTVREAGALARQLGTVVHVHVAEADADVDDARRRGFAGPLERLLALDALPPGSILAHGVHLDAAQVRRADELGLWLVQNPRSNAGNRVGYPGALSASAHVALGTDGYPADMAVERAALLRDAATHGDTGAAARPEAGARLAAERLGLASLPDRVVRDAAGVRHVIVGGRVVVEGGVLQTGDLAAIRAEAREQAGALWRRMEAL
ncbi:MAG: amidohydrolase family protein [Deltaproteobacteria bacterium]|nr:amidohydrolase family protein [Deltaproteobacteria bacterium]